MGNYIETSPELVKRMVREGHLVGNHTYTHPDMSEIASEEAFREELTKLEEAFSRVTGKKMKKYYRPPQGKYSDANLKMAEKMGYKTVFWSLAYVDWYESDQPTEEEAHGKTHTKDSSGSHSAASQHLKDQQRDTGSAPNKMEGYGIQLQIPGRY